MQLIYCHVLQLLAASPLKMLKKLCLCRLEFLLHLLIALGDIVQQLFTLRPCVLFELLALLLELLDLLITDGQLAANTENMNDTRRNTQKLSM